MIKTPGDTLKRRDFLAASASGYKWVTPAFIIQVNPCPSLSALSSPLLSSQRCRIGFTVTRRLGGAVIRNRIKRRLRAAMKEIARVHAKKYFQEPADIIIIARLPARTINFLELIEQLSYGIYRLYKQISQKNRS